MTERGHPHSKIIYDLDPIASIQLWPPMRLAVPLRSCAAHGHNFWLGYDSRSFGGRFFRPAYLRDLFADFDPQPYRVPVLGQRIPDHAVRLIDGGWPTPDTQYVVLIRDGDRLTIRQIGMPDHPVTETTVGSVWPARYVQPSTRSCGK